MKKLLPIAAILSSIVIFSPAAAEAKASSSAVEAPQIRVQVGRGRRNVRRPRTAITTRIVGFGRNRYRETIRTTYLPNGRRIVQVISRHRIGWGRG